MGVMQSSETDSSPTTGPDSTNNSGFNGPYSSNSNNGNNESKTNGKEWPSSKYYDLYDYNTTTTNYKNGIFGDGVKEFGPFYSVSWPKTGNTNYTRYVGSYNVDAAYFVNSGYPWFIRGAAHTDGTDAGVSSFNINYGHADSNSSFRIILTP